MRYYEIQVTPEDRENLAQLTLLGQESSGDRYISPFPYRGFWIMPASVKPDQLPDTIYARITYVDADRNNVKWPAHTKHTGTRHLLVNVWIDKPAHQEFAPVAPNYLFERLMPKSRVPQANGAGGRKPIYTTGRMVAITVTLPDRMIEDFSRIGDEGGVSAGIRIAKEKLDEFMAASEPEQLQQQQSQQQPKESS